MLISFLSVCLLILTLSPVVYSRLLFTYYLNPITVVAIITFPIKFFIYFGPIISNHEVNDGLAFAISMEILYLFIQLVVTLIIITSKQGHIFDRFILSDRHLSQKNLAVCTYFFFFLFLLTFWILANSTVGLIEWLKDPRYAYINYRRGSGAVYALSVNFLCISAFFSFVNTRTPRNLLIKFVFFGILLVFFGSKGGVIALLISYIVIDGLLFGIYLKRYIFLLPFLIAPVIYMILQSGLNSIDRFVKYFDYFSNAAEYYTDYLNGDYPLQQGKIFISGFWGMVPRSIFEQKPIIYGMLHIVEHYYPGGPASGNTPAFGARVQYFADFGVLGLLIFAILSPWNLFYSFALVVLFNNRYESFSTTNLNFLFVFAMIFGPQFGVYFPGLSYVVLTWLLFSIAQTTSKFTY